MSIYFLIICEKYLVVPEGIEPPPPICKNGVQTSRPWNYLVEQVMRIELTQSAWKAEVLPLNYTCIWRLVWELNPWHQRDRLILLPLHQRAIIFILGKRPPANRFTIVKFSSVESAFRTGRWFYNCSIIFFTINPYFLLGGDYGIQTHLISSLQER